MNKIIKLRIFDGINMPINIIEVGKDAISIKESHGTSGSCYIVEFKNSIKKFRNLGFEATYEKET